MINHMNRSLIHDVLLSISIDGGSRQISAFEEGNAKGLRQGFGKKEL